MKTLLQFFRLCAPFWGNRRHWRDWLILAAIIGLALLLIRVSVAIADWNKTFYDALAAFEGEKMLPLIVQYLGYIALVVAIAVSSSWLRKALMFRWRAHLTHQFQQDWLAGHKHYRLQHGKHEPDNPDQRIAEDVALLAEKSLDLFKNFVLNLARLVAFVAILWGLSGVQTLEIGGSTVQIHGYLVWVALLYSVLCTLFTHFIGRKLQPLNVARQHREADYRATLLRVRDHSEQIALYHGESQETHRLNQRFARIQQNWRELINRELKLELFSATYLRVSLFIPIFATLPLYLARTMTFGDMMQARNAFSNVQDGFGWFMDYYKRLIEWAAVVERLADFQHALAQTSPFPEPPAIPEGPMARLKLYDLSVSDAHGKVLLQGINLHAKCGQWWLLDGQSGIGKSSLLRTIAGLTPPAAGAFSLASGRTLFLPQRPYLPHDSLRAVLCYPHANASDNLLRTALETVDLARLCTQLDEEKAWDKCLSGGEQQRLSLARALLHAPQILFLDEATNQLDDPAALALMRTIRHALPYTLCVAISHQPPVKALFDHTLNLNTFRA